MLPVTVQFNRSPLDTPKIVGRRQNQLLSTRERHRSGPGCQARGLQMILRRSVRILHSSMNHETRQRCQEGYPRNQAGIGKKVCSLRHRAHLIGQYGI